MNWDIFFRNLNFSLFDFVQLVRKFNFLSFGKISCWHLMSDSFFFSDKFLEVHFFNFISFGRFLSRSVDDINLSSVLIDFIFNIINVFIKVIFVIIENYETSFGKVNVMLLSFDLISECFWTIFVVVFFLLSEFFELLNFLLKLINFFIKPGLIRFDFRLFRHLWDFSIVTNFPLIILEPMLVLIPLFLILISWFTIIVIVIVVVLIPFILICSFFSRLLLLLIFCCCVRVSCSGFLLILYFGHFL